ncbi:hypothetical protein GCM10022254_41480 [Actinomadura meridiana]|uniref:Uncharacterized protein n=2 Tax=Actinomadura meridiana TaxID=559626 RepID=A0ABP8C7E7_9ACTN
MPGQRAAGWTYFTHQESPSEVVSLRIQRDVKLSRTCWVNPAASGYRTTARATDIAVGKRDTSRSVTNGQAEVSFVVTRDPATYALGKRIVSVIFRDSSGRLLNANGQSIGSDSRYGQRKHFMTWVPVKADTKRTEVMLEPEQNNPTSSCMARP